MKRSILALVLACSTVPAPAQSIGASLSGVVQDGQSGRISGAAVTVRNIGNNYEIRLQTDADGMFRVPSIATGE
jgi:hypothetical protein